MVQLQMTFLLAVLSIQIWFSEIFLPYKYESLKSSFQITWFSEIFLPYNMILWDLQSIWFDHDLHFNLIGSFDSLTLEDTFLWACGLLSLWAWLLQFKKNKIINTFEKNEPNAQNVIKSLFSLLFCSKNSELWY